MSRFPYTLRTAALGLLLTYLFLLSGCLHIRLHTSIFPNGRASRRLDISVNAEYRARLEEGRNSDGVATALKQEGWRETTYMRDGQFHWVLTRDFHDVKSMSDRMIETAFGRWVKVGAYQEGDAVDFDPYHGVFKTTYTFRESFHFYPDLDSFSLYEKPPSPIQIEISVHMPGKVLEAPGAAQSDNRSAVWQFSVSSQDTAVFNRDLLVKSGRSHFWPQFFIGALIILFIVYLPYQFLHLRPVAQQQDNS